MRVIQPWNGAPTTEVDDLRFRTAMLQDFAIGSDGNELAVTNGHRLRFWSLSVHRRKLTVMEHEICESHGILATEFQRFISTPSFRTSLLRDVLCFLIALHNSSVI